MGSLSQSSTTTRNSAAVTQLDSKADDGEGKPFAHFDVYGAIAAAKNGEGKPMMWIYAGDVDFVCWVVFEDLGE